MEWKRTRQGGRHSRYKNTISAAQAEELIHHLRDTYSDTQHSLFVDHGGFETEQRLTEFRVVLIVLRHQYSLRNYWQPLAVLHTAIQATGT